MIFRSVGPPRPHRALVGISISANGLFSVSLTPLLPPSIIRTLSFRIQSKSAQSSPHLYFILFLVRRSLYRDDSIRFLNQSMDHARSIIANHVIQLLRASWMISCNTDFLFCQKTKAPLLAKPQTLDPDGPTEFLFLALSHILSAGP